MKDEELLLRKSIPSLLWIYARPSMFASLITGLYGIIDGIFIGQKMGPAGIAAITLAFPVTTFLIAMGALLSIGTSIQVNRQLAAGHPDIARTYIKKGLNLFLLLGLTLTALALLTPSIMGILGKGTNQYVVDLAQSFISILLFGSFLYMAPILTSDLLKNLGKPREAMFSMILGTLTTIALDYLFIFRLDLEMVGAALATLAGQLIALLVSLFFLRRCEIWASTPNIFHHPLRTYWDILKTGFSTFVIQISTMLLLLVHNRLFLYLGNELYVSSFGIIGYGLMAYWMLTNGYAGGAQPIISYNQAIGEKGRVHNVLRLSLLLVTVFSILYSLLFYLFPHQIIAIFSQHDVQLYNLTRTGFRLVMFALPFAGINVIAAMYFQAIGKARISLFLALGRVLFFMVPLIFLLPRLFQVQGIYLIVPLSEVFTAALSILFLVRNVRSKTHYIPIRSPHELDDPPKA